jgi:hypothetical protein
MATLGPPTWATGSWATDVWEDAWDVAAVAGNAFQQNAFQDDAFQIEEAAGGINEGDEVQCVIAGGTLCNVTIGSGPGVRVVISSVNKITVLIEGGTTLHVTI